MNKFFVYAAGIDASIFILLPHLLYLISMIMMVMRKLEGNKVLRSNNCIITFWSFWNRRQSSCLATDILSSSVDPDVSCLANVLRHRQTHIPFVHGFIRGNVWQRHLLILQILQENIQNFFIHASCV